MNRNNKISKKVNELLHITKNHNDKMEGMQSLSTSCICNGNCQRNRLIDGSICQHCYADTMQKRFSNLTKALMRNGDILSREMAWEDLPIITNIYFRFEAFGDLINTTHLINYVNIARKNPKVSFALWTKCYLIAETVFTKMGIEKPQNLRIVISSLMMDTPMVKPSWADTVFTVWSSEEKATECGKVINCGTKKCINCHVCYDGNAEEINELIKSKQKRK